MSIREFRTDAPLNPLARAAERAARRTDEEAELARRCQKQDPAARADADAPDASAARSAMIERNNSRFVPSRAPVRAAPAAAGETASTPPVNPQQAMLDRNAARYKPARR